MGVQVGGMAARCRDESVNLGAPFHLDFVASHRAQSVEEWISPIVAAVPGQLFSLGLSLAKGLDPDRPRGLRKVTKTR